MVTKQSVLEAHALIEQFEKCLPGILKDELLDSAIAGQVYYETLADQLFHVSSSIDCEHIFNDGNKRTAYAILQKLEEDYDCVDLDRLGDLILALAKSEISKDDFMEQARSCVVSLDNLSDF